ncbi:hypothetical protein RND81_03G032000 [Saponaria officinalis]|uniref:Uncharacterized protein n=1 Tax=Saponaria officinalis TaxID=3572 RepID=A0AAW1LXY4_SAPOF
MLLEAPVVKRRYIMEVEGSLSITNQDSRPTLRSRGTSAGLKANNSKGLKFIEFDDKGRPIGLWRDKFSCDMGIIARNIKITIEDWSKVPEGQKESIWLDAKNKWNITDAGKRKAVLCYVSLLFKDFKTYLTVFFIYKTRNQRRKVSLDDPLSIYPQITNEVWEEFVRQRMDGNIQEKSKKVRVA